MAPPRTFAGGRLTREHPLAESPNEFSVPLGGRYRVERELGRGGMAVVYLATDTTTGEQVALKLLDQEVGVAVGAERFRREVKITSALSHPNILPVLDAGEANGQLYFVMPVVEGDSLQVLLEREVQLPVDEAVRITREVASALSYAHERGIVHRDVKPENVLMQDGRALLADFGIARASADLRTTQALTRTGMSLGTPAYMSPEQASADRDLDGRSDQYSLACVLYELLAGQAPFTAKTAQGLMARHMLEPVPSISIVRSTVPRQVEDAIVRAMAKSPADRFATIAEFADALGTRETWTTTGPTRTHAMPNVATAMPRSAGRRRVLAKASGVAVVAAGAWAVATWSGKGNATPVPAVLVAVAPFNPLRPEFALWQEGMVDVLSRNLDGAGPLGTVSPAVATRGWAGRKADRQSARELATRTSAQYAVFGSLNSGPAGTVRLNASLLDVTGDSLWDASFVGVDVPQLADSATRFVLALLGERYTIAASRQSPLAGTSVEALKLFLQGEQHFRRTAWDPALAAYTRAAAIDTAFALPLRRMSQIVGFQRNNADSLVRAYALHAGRLNRGLAPRDSLLVVSDSLFAALSQDEDEPSDWATLRRLFATLQEAVRRYPSDPETWYALGEAREHWGYGTVTDVTDEGVFAAFERAIALDPGFAPAYIHAIELAFRLRGREAGQRHVRAYLALGPTDKEADGIRLVDRLTDPARANTPETARLLDTLPSAVLWNAMDALLRWPDANATAMTLVHAVARRPRTSATFQADSGKVLRYLPLQLAYRGRLREAYEALGNRRGQLFAELVLLGGIERDTANAVFGQWLADGAPQARSALPHWAAHGNVESIRRFRSRADSLVRMAKGDARLVATHDARAARAYLHLAERDTAAAVTVFASLSDTLCINCYLDRLTAARLHGALNRPQAADSLLRQRLYSVLTPAHVLMAMERGRVAQRLSDTATARRAFALVVDAWELGDPEVQPMVAEARIALRVLGMPGKPAASTGAP